MKNLVDRLESFDPELKCLNVIIETPKGSGIKYSYDEDSGLFLVKRALPEGMMFPFNFGFVPSTRADDGDPLDILVFNEGPLIPGCLVKARLLGAMKAEQTEDGKTFRNDRLLAQAIPKESPKDLESVELTRQLLDQIEYFFISYNRIDGKKFKVLGQGGPNKARKLIQQAGKKYAKEK